jgi:hypothetical protein
MPLAGKPSRTKPLKTKKGLTLYYRGKDRWEVDYPEDAWSGKGKRYGRASTIRVMTLIYYLAKNYPIEKADRLAFG